MKKKKEPIEDEVFEYNEGPKNWRQVVHDYELNTDVLKQLLREVRAANKMLERRVVALEGGGILTKSGVYSAMGPKPKKVVALFCNPDVLAELWDQAGFIPVDGYLPDVEPMEHEVGCLANVGLVRSHSGEAICHVGEVRVLCDDEEFRKFINDDSTA